MYEIFLVCLAIIDLPLATLFLLGRLFGLGLGKEAYIVIEDFQLRNRSPLLIKVVLDIQMSEDKVIIRLTNSFRATFQSPYEHLA